MKTPGFRATSILFAFLVTSVVPAPIVFSWLQDSPSSTPEIFADVTSKVGLDFVHFNGMVGELHYVEMVGSGGAFLDYDNDGDLDIYLVQGAAIAEDGTGAGVIAVPKEPPADRLYRNDLQDGAGGEPVLQFTDVTEESGIQAIGYGMGVAAGDYNNDGWVDLYVTNYGSNQLFRNNGDGTFADVTQEAGVDDRRWSTSASFVDYDRDGWLDLYVCNYVKYKISENVKCYTDSSARDYCGPSAFEPEPDRLFRNRGDGAFEDVSAGALPGARPAHGLGVVTADFNQDGWVDIYVANDGRPNQMWINQKNGTLRDGALLSGTALNWMGQAEGSMGVDAGDFDGDGDEDLFMTHIKEETNTIYVNDGTGLFEDRSLGAGLGAPSLLYTAFGTIWIDQDNDGWLDLVVVNGAVRIIDELVRKGDPYPLHQPNQFYRNLSGGRFGEETARAGSAFELSEVTRGAAVGDVDNDGDADLLFVNNNGPVRLLTNQVGNRSHWLGLKLMGESTRRDMLGARVEVIRASGPPLVRRVRTDGGYCSSNDPRVLVGLNGTTGVEKVRVYWPGGGAEEWTSVHINEYNLLRQGEGVTLVGSR